MDKAKVEMKYKIMAVLEIITGIAITVFWICFFTIGVAPANPPPGWFVYEHAFPLPDLVMSFSMFVAAYLLLKGSDAGKTLSLVNSGALVFLGMVDFSFNFQNDLYSGPFAEAAGNIWMNFEVTAVGVYIMVCLLKEKFQSDRQTIR